MNPATPKQRSKGIECIPSTSGRYIALCPNEEFIQSLNLSH